MSFNMKEYSLVDIVEYKTGKLNSNAAIENGKYPFFTCSPHTLSIDSYSFDQDAVLLAGNNANGVFAIKHYKGKFDAYQRTYVMSSINHNIINNRYLYYALGLQLNLLKNLSVGSATKFLTKSIIDNIKINVPVNPNQMRVTEEILNNIDKKIETNNQINKTLENMAQSIFKQWFIDFEFPNEDGEPYKSSGGQMVESELGMIPEGWSYIELKNILDVNPTYKMVKDDEYRFVSMKELRQNSSAIDLNGVINKKYKSGGMKFSNGDTLVARITPCLENGKTAYIDFLDRVEIAYGSTEFIVMRMKEGLSLPISYIIARNESFRDYAIKHMTGSSGRQRVSRDSIEKLKVAMPNNLELLRNYGVLVESYFNIIPKNNTENHVLANIRDTLLPKLMSGEIRVPLEEN